jgi:TolB-like protein
MERRFRCWVFPLVVVLACGCATGQGSRRTAKLSTPPIVVAVLDFQNDAADPELDYLVRGIPEVINTRLARSGRLRILEQQTRFYHRFNEELMWNTTGTIDEQVVAATEFGRIVDADVVVTGSFVQVGAVVQISTRLIDVQAGGG